MQVTDVTYRDVKGIEDFEHVVGIELSEGYEWDSLQAWYSPSRRKFFWLDGSGCSCNYLGMNVYGIDDFEFGNKESLIAAIRRKYDNTYYRVRPSDMLEDIAKVKKFTAVSA